MRFKVVCSTKLEPGSPSGFRTNRIGMAHAGCSASRWARVSCQSTAVQRRTTYKVSFLGGRIPLDLRFRGSLEAQSFVRAPTIDPPGAPGRVCDLKCRSCGYDRRCNNFIHVSRSETPCCAVLPVSCIYSYCPLIHCRTACHGHGTNYWFLSMEGDANKSNTM